jgi:hypothetical protein
VLASFLPLWGASARGSKRPSGLPRRRVASSKDLIEELLMHVGAGSAFRIASGSKLHAKSPSRYSLKNLRPPKSLAPMPVSRRGVRNRRRATSIGATGESRVPRHGIAAPPFPREYEIWLPFLDTYRTMCLAPPPEFRQVLEQARDLPIAA